jgi:Generalcontrol nonderepressible 1 (Gcn1) N-terminal
MPHFGMLHCRSLWIGDESSSCRTQVGLVLLHLSLESTSLHLRRTVVAAIEKYAIRSPQLINLIIREALTSFLSREPAPSVKAASGLEEEQQTSSSNQGRLAQLLLHCVAFNDALEISEKEDILVELIILSHHQLACMFNACFPKYLSSSSSWCRFCFTANLDRVMSKVSNRSA